MDYACLALIHSAGCIYYGILHCLRNLPINCRKHRFLLSLGYIRGGGGALGLDQIFWKYEEISCRKCLLRAKKGGDTSTMWIPPLNLPIHMWMGRLSGGIHIVEVSPPFFARRRHFRQEISSYFQNIWSSPNAPPPPRMYPNDSRNLCFRQFIGRFLRQCKMP